MAEKKERCPNCHKEVEKEAKFCQECGEELNKEKKAVSVEGKEEPSEKNKNNEKEAEEIVVEEIKKGEQVSPPVQPTKSKNLPISIAGFICSLFGIVTCGLSAIVGLILSIIGLEKSKKNGHKDTLAIAGIVISIIFLYLIIFAIGHYDSNNLGTPNGGSSYQQEETLDEYINSCSEIDYESIARQPEYYKGTRAHFRGKIIQVEEGFLNSVILRVDVTEGTYGIWTDTVYVTYTYGDGESKLLEDDIINMYGVIKGTKTYTTIFGASVTIPYLDAEYIFIE